MCVCGTWWEGGVDHGGRRKRERGRGDGGGKRIHEEVKLPEHVCHYSQGRISQSWGVVIGV